MNARLQQSARTLVSALLVILGAVVPAIADSALEQRLARLDSALAKHPDQVALLLARAELYLDPSATAAMKSRRSQALVDLEAADSLAPATAQSQVLWAQWWLAVGNRERALVAAVRAPELAEPPLLALTHVRVAALAEQLERHDLAAKHRLSALEALSRHANGGGPSPELYLLTSDSLVSAQRASDALWLLDCAIADIGPITSLLERRNSLLKEPAQPPRAASPRPECPP